MDRKDHPPREQEDDALEKAKKYATIVLAILALFSVVRGVWEVVNIFFLRK